MVYLGFFPIFKHCKFLIFFYFIFLNLFQNETKQINENN